MTRHRTLFALVLLALVGSAVAAASTGTGTPGRSASGTVACAAMFPLCVP